MGDLQRSRSWRGQLADLRRVAEAADDDGLGRRWRWRGGYPQAIFRDGDVILVAETFTDPDSPAKFAQFIATFDPPTVLGLIAAAEEALGKEGE